MAVQLQMVHCTGVYDSTKPSTSIHVAYPLGEDRRMMEILLPFPKALE